jgi:hypothetical protein
LPILPYDFSKLLKLKELKFRLFCDQHFAPFAARGGDDKKDASAAAV